MYRETLNKSRSIFNTSNKFGNFLSYVFTISGLGIFTTFGFTFLASNLFINYFGRTANVLLASCVLSFGANLIMMWTQNNLNSASASTGNLLFKFSLNNILRSFLMNPLIIIIKLYGIGYNELYLSLAATTGIFLFLSILANIFQDNFSSNNSTMQSITKLLFYLVFFIFGISCLGLIFNMFGSNILWNFCSNYLLTLHSMLIILLCSILILNTISDLKSIYNNNINNTSSLTKIGIIGANSLCHGFIIIFIEILSLLLKNKFNKRGKGE
jgi:hypothetical protein